MSVAKRGTDDRACGMVNNDLIHQAICRLVASGVTVVAAAGNNGFNAANLKPASYNEVITVSALADTDGKAGGTGGALCYSWGTYDRDDTFADFSNYGGGRGPHRARQVHLVHPAGQPLRLHLRDLDGRPARDRRGRAVQVVAPARDARGGPRGAPRGRDPRLEHRDGPGLGPRAAAGRVAPGRPRRLHRGRDARDLAVGARRCGRCLPGAPRLARPRRGLPRTRCTSPSRRRHRSRRPSARTRWSDRTRWPPRCGSRSPRAPPAEPTRSP